jgi:antitoxin (DNA-binding transcriptional repressor) of toxin-antitoxin stability system
MPAARAAIGNRLVSVMPGETFTSTSHGRPSTSIITSVRPTSRKASVSNARDASYRHAAATSADTRAGAKYSVAPAVYRAA